MSRSAWFYVGTIIFIGLLSVVATSQLAPLPLADQALPLIVITVLAFVSKLPRVTIKTQVYNFFLISVFAGLLILHPFLFALMIIGTQLLEWIKDFLGNRGLWRNLLRHWYRVPFNTATYIISGLVAKETYYLVNPEPLAWFSPLVLLAPLLSAAVFTLINHLLIGLALVFTKRMSLRQSGTMDADNLMTDLVLLLMGAICAELWKYTPWLIPISLAPLILMYRALQVPQLKEQATTDPKTGLLNARHFRESFTLELARAKRFNRPLSVVMADLDLLRKINNTHGHLAGDAVLIGIGKLIRESVRDYDIAGRFGGEEFAIVLPETTQDIALVFAERLRAAVEATPFEVERVAKPIRATLSLGIATFPTDATRLDDLIHKADIAVYQAKARGRNCVVNASDVPPAFERELTAPEAHTADS